MSSVAAGRRRYSDQHAKAPAPDLKALAQGGGLGLGRVRAMAASGDEAARKALREVGQVVDKAAEYDT